MCQIFCLVFLGSHNNPKFTYPFFSKQHLTISDNKHEQLMLYLYIYILPHQLLDCAVPQVITAVKQAG